ncbi:MAG TPA: hypothetical protein PK140_23135 [Polyangiaceae bacterium]|jgi:hypothetical protein|nr:hypothetical protein [Polyangiaceae bacterium]
MASKAQHLEFLAHKLFMRDVSPSLRPDLHACMRKLRVYDRERWHSAGVRVKKLAALDQPVFEARLNRGDRLVFTLRSAQSDRFDGIHIVLWYAGHHDDAVRTAVRRMGIGQRAIDALVDDQPWDESLWGGDNQKQIQLVTPDGATRRDLPPLVEFSEYEMDRWAESQIDPLLHLSPAQRELTRVAEDRPVFLRGGVGTGKTTVLLYRMLKLLLAGSIENPVFMTFSKSLATWCRSIFERLPGAERRKVEFTSLSGWLRAHFGATRGGKRLFRLAWEKAKLPSNPEPAWWELQRLRGSAAFQGEQPTRGDQLPSHVSPEIQIAYDAYRKLLNGAPDVLDLAWKAYDYYRAESALMNLPFDAVFIDEAQDLTPIEWLVCILMGNRPKLAFFCGDETQDVRDTRFSWEGVEAALRLVGHRAPAFSFFQLHENRRNSEPIALVLQRLAERFDLGATTHAGSEEGPSPLVCVTSRKIAEQTAQRAGCPVLLDLEAREERSPNPFFWVLDLEHIKGLEFHVLPLWAPAGSWPSSPHLARKLFTAISRAMHGLVIFTDHATAPAFEQLGASPADSRTVHNFLDSCRPLMAFDREAVAKWKEIPFSEARSWVQDGLGSWADFRLSLSHWASEVPFSTARLWVENGLCSWAIFHEQLMEWTDEVSPALAADWVRNGLLLRRDFAHRAQQWVWAARFDDAVAWVDAGLLGWEDFQPRLAEWTDRATLPLACAWVSAKACRWIDLQRHLPNWSEQATLWQARAWVEEEAISWKSFENMLSRWFSEVDVDLASLWVRQGYCTWESLRHRLPSWRDTVGYSDARTWQEQGLIDWSALAHRLAFWMAEASYEHACRWVEAGWCSWKDAGKRVEVWLPEASAEQAIAWLKARQCDASQAWRQCTRWRSSLTFSQASALVEAGACSWHGLAPRLGEWTELVTFLQACTWVGEELCMWTDFENRIAQWTPEATRELATEWVRLNLCSWEAFADRIASWKPGASLEQATGWVDAGLATWKDFELNLPRWSESAEPWRVEQWREQGLVSKQLAKAARKRRR